MSINAVASLLFLNRFVLSYDKVFSDVHGEKKGLSHSVRISPMDYLLCVTVSVFPSMVAM